jgi:hypothetical protein
LYEMATLVINGPDQSDTSRIVYLVRLISKVIALHCKWFMLPNDKFP